MAKAKKSAKAKVSDLERLKARKEQLLSRQSKLTEQLGKLEDRIEELERFKTPEERKLFRSITSASKRLQKLKEEAKAQGIEI